MIGLLRSPSTLAMSHGLCELLATHGPNGSDGLLFIEADKDLRSRA